MISIIDPGHSYTLSNYDGAGEQRLDFLKREGAGYPGNVGTNAGTNCQDVLRVLIDRVSYLQSQIHCPENEQILAHLRAAILAFEQRAATRHGGVLPVIVGPIESIPACRACGHLYCSHALEGKKQERAA